MAQHYSDPRRAADPHALPNVEVWEDAVRECPRCLAQQIAPSDRIELCVTEGCSGTLDPNDNENRATLGWFWWSCSPGCLPDSDPVGPFATEAEALADATEGEDDGA